MKRRRQSAGDGLFAAEAGPAREPRRARVVAGIDEAGLGPLLGPLTLGFSAFAGPTVEHELWPALAPACTRENRHDAERLVVADSKEVFSRDPRGERRLEATALAFLALARAPRRWPDDARALLEQLAPELLPGCAWAEEAWTGALADRLPWAACPEELAARCNLLQETLALADVELVDLGHRAIPVRELNGSFDRTQSKARTHWELSLPIFLRLWERCAAEGLDLFVDRHGGRMRYRALLEEGIPRARVVTVIERAELSEYMVEEVGGARWMRVRFAERAETSSFPVALGSCIAKYVRETCMRAFNAYFERLQPGLEPTAGYVLDGRRWLAQAGPAIERSGLARRDLIRER